MFKVIMVNDAFGTNRPIRVWEDGPNRPLLLGAKLDEETERRLVEIERDISKILTAIRAIRDYL